MKTLIAMTLGLAVVLSGCNCNPPACDPGTTMCACKEGGVCNEGLSCGADNKCAPPVAAGLQVDAAARGCELLLTEAGSTVVSANFKNGVKGTFIRQPPKVAVTFVSAGDSAIGNNVELGLSGPSSGLTVSRSACVDVSGARISATVSIQ